MNVKPVQLSAQSEAVRPQLYPMLREMIIRGDIAPGARIPETGIATVWSVSRQPVRGTFIRLAERALADVRPQHGTLVSLISVPAVLSARFIREAVEADISRDMAETADAATPSLLDARMAERHALGPEASSEDFLYMGENFHRTSAEPAVGAAVADRLEELNIHVDRVRHTGADRFSRERLITQHSDVVEAIRLRLREIVADLPGIVAARPDFFEGADALADLP